MNIVESLLLSFLAMAACSALPTLTKSRRLNHRSPRHSKPRSSQKLSSHSQPPQNHQHLNHHTPEQFRSAYVTFSKDKPESPPWLESAPTSGHRQKRSINNTLESPSKHIKMSVCESTGAWVEKQTALDMYGNTLRIVQSIDIGGTRMTQYFYERYCAEENCQCRGIDTVNYTSKCETKNTWVKAKVMDHFDNVGWNYISVRSACGCSVTEKEQEEESIWDELFAR